MSAVKEQQDRFYSSIAHYYSSIFPFNPAQMGFLENENETLEKLKFLDAGCGSGELAYALATRGAIVSAIDINEALLNQAKANRSHERITWQMGNMLDIVRLFDHSGFDGVICFGNTLVHLDNPEQVLDFFRSVYAVLKPGGKFYLQILNYDHIFREHLETLPLIENEEFRFDRGYRFIKGSRKLRFVTCLTIKSTGEIMKNETELLGLGSEELIHLLEQAGLERISLYADFAKHPFGGKHLPLVVSSFKNRGAMRE
jgi:2-polyprenyl-3-methyl-5-hydroxy-6-metoxy-1,4-benzoquinol methylase